MVRDVGYPAGGRLTMRCADITTSSINIKSVVWWDYWLAVREYAPVASMGYSVCRRLMDEL